MKLSRSSSLPKPSTTSTPQPPRRSNSVDSPRPSNTTQQTTRPQPQRTDTTQSTRPRNPEGASRVNSTETGAAKKPTTNTEIRAWYKAKIATIPANDAKLQAQGASLQERAKAAHEIRHSARTESRQFMNPIESAMLKARDFFTYGRLDGPSFDDLVAKSKKEGLSEAQAFDKIINSSQRTNQAVDSVYAKPQAKL
jgi:hypothetical protein